MKIHKIAFILLIIGGLNWGLHAFDVGIGRFLPEWLSMVVYILVALSAVYEIFGHKKICNDCGKSNSMQQAAM